ncbi:CsxC family protein [Jeotgalibacillus marinus]|uniref:CsxC family protein n=1 Tax=Jeotgalibacillus marinus TaxID=86667 RepID=A0ABV3Q3K0_9BACL
MTEVPLTNEPSTPFATFARFIKVPAVLAEPTLQIVVEADIALDPPALEIKRVLKDIFLTQCKLLPVAFRDDIRTPGLSPREATRAKLFVEGFIRKKIEYSTADCNGVIRDRIADVPFSGFTDLRDDDDDFFLLPLLGESSRSSSSRFINQKNSTIPRQDQYFFENSVFYNEQPYCELVSANFFELDFSPNHVDANETFNKLREKIVVDLSLTVLQVRQIDLQTQAKK